MRGSPFRARASTTSAVSVTVISSATVGEDGRWGLRMANIGWNGMSVGATIELHESGTKIWGMGTDASAGWALLDLTEKEWIASDKNTRLAMVSGGDGNLTGLFIGSLRS